MPRIGVVITDEMNEVLQGIADEQGATISNLIRMAVVEFLEKKGKSIEKPRIRWGGSRHKGKVESQEDAEALEEEQ